MDDQPQTKTPKGERTRGRILQAALDLFDEHGYEGASMRAIADAAGVSVGNAYYYFASKEHLIQGFYERLHRDHRAACDPILAEETDLKSRLLGVHHAFFDVAVPHHRFASVLFKTAADPRSPLNPFSAESAPARKQAIDLMRSVVDEGRTRLPADLRRELPELLWLHHMGLVLYWIHDTSPDGAKTRRLIDSSTQLVMRAIQVLKLPLTKPLRRAALKLLADLRP